VRRHCEKEEVFNNLCARNKRRLLALARACVGPSHYLELYREMGFEIWRSLEGYEGSAHLDSWVYRVALNTALHFRENANHSIQSCDAIAEEQVPYSASVRTNQSEFQKLEEFIHSVPEADQAVFLLYLEDLSCREIADITGLGDSDVSIKINRLKQSLMERCIRA